METVKIKDAIDFYTFANKLKYIEFSDINQTYADQIYGRLILAVALNSEFKLTDDIGKVLRMLTLEEVIKRFGTSSLEKLSKGEKYLDELEEINLLKTPEALTVDDCKKLENRLNDLILSFKKDGLTIEKLYNKAIDKGIFCPKNLEEDEKYREVFRFYYINHGLKERKRSGWDETHWNVTSNRKERVSEHVFGTVILALAIDSQFDFDVDIDKVIETLAIHEVGENIIGDVTPFDLVSPEEKKNIEHMAVVQVMGDLADSDRLTRLIFEFDEGESSEAKFAFYCDKLEADIQAKIYQDGGYQHPLTEQENNIVFKSSKIQKMVQDGAKTAFDIWYLWDKDIYTESPVLVKTLNYVRDNKLD